MLNYKLFEKYVINKLLYSIFDWDDNILKMATPLHFKKNINGEWVDTDITPQEFAEVRKEHPTDYLDNEDWKGDPNYSFIEFRDHGPRGRNAFIEDVKKSIELGNFGPSWNKFIQTLVHGRIFAIITTRGHEPDVLKDAVKYIIYNILTKSQRVEMIENLKEFDKLFNIDTDDEIESYLNDCYFIGLFSKAFEKQFGYNPQGKLLNKGKQDAIEYFVFYVRDFAKEKKLPLKIGFSDDDIRFSSAAKELFMSTEKSLDFPENFYVYDTSNPDIEGGEKIKI